MYQTCKKYELNTKVIHWVKDKQKIQSSEKGSKRVKFDRKAQYPEMEVKLLLEYKEPS